MKIFIAEIRKMKAYIKEINSLKFEEIEWMIDDENAYPIDQNLKDEFFLSGLPNFDFVDFLPGNLHDENKKCLVISGTHKNLEFEPIGFYKTVTGKSWRDSETDEAIVYAMRIMRDGLPYDDHVILGKIKNRLVCIHETEVSF